MTKQLKILTLLALLLSTTGCQYGVLGKKGTAAVTNLEGTVGSLGDKTLHAIDTAETNALKAIHETRDTIINFLQNQSAQVAHDISVGILKGTIGYLDSPGNRNNLGSLLKIMIDSSVGPAREQLIQFRDDLLDPQATKNLRTLLQGIMHDLILDPTANLLNLALNPTTKRNLQGMLQMLIPAALNDSAIGQIAKLRSVLLGYEMKKDIAGLVDTALLTANRRLDSPLGQNLHAILHQTSSDVRGIALWIIITLGVFLLAAAGIGIWLHKRAQLNQDLLGVVTREIEKFNAPTTPANAAFYNDLTDNIQKRMTANNLERYMYRFLKDRNIS